MTVRSGRLDLTLSAHVISDGSGSHCTMNDVRESKGAQYFYCPHCRERACCAFHFNNF